MPTIVKIANALGTTVDGLLCDSLEKARVPFEQEIANLLSDCSDEEIRVIAFTMSAFKSGLRQMGRPWEK